MLDGLQLYNWAALKQACDASGTYELSGAVFSSGGSAIKLDRGQTVGINGNGAVLDAGKQGRLFYVFQGALTLQNMTLQNGADDSGVS
jgi:hypothetical protein